MRILISLSSHLFSELLHSFLAKQRNVQALIYDGRPAIGAFIPDIVLVDFKQIDKELRSQWPEAKFILIDTGIKEGEIIRLLISYKIHGIISLDTDSQLFKKALDAIWGNQIWIDNSSIKALLNSTELTLATGQLKNAIQVSQREKDVIELICQGYTNKEIASKIFISEQTVKTHLHRIYRKLNVSNRSQMIALVMKESSLIS